MKSKYLILLYVLSLVAGALLAIYWQRADIFTWVVRAIGIIMIIPCVVCLIAAFIPVKKGEGETAFTVQRSFAWTMILAGIGGTVFGALLLIMPDFFVKYLVYTLGIVLIIFGVVQLSFVSMAMRSDRISGWFLVVPIATLVAGVGIICIGTDRIQTVAALVTGIILIIYSINGFWGIAGRSVNHRVHAKQDALERENLRQEIESDFEKKEAEKEAENTSKQDADSEEKPAENKP